MLVHFLYTIEYYLFVFSETEASLHVAESPVPSVRVTIVQPVRPAAEHQLPRRLAQPHAEVRATTLYSATLPRATWSVIHLSPKSRTF